MIYDKFTAICGALVMIGMALYFGASTYQDREKLSELKQKYYVATHSGGIMTDGDDSVVIFNEEADRRVRFKGRPDFTVERLTSDGKWRVE